jgi:phage terminase Nu1 subunit (DNA packaging protein)
MSGPAAAGVLPAGKLVRAVVLADALGINERSVRSLAERAIIERTPEGLYPLKESIRAYCHHVREAAAGRNGHAAGSGLAAEREREVRERADHLAMRNAAARRELLPASDVETAWARICRQLRARMLATPGRIQQRLGHLTAHDVSIIDREIRDALTTLGTNDL